MAKTFCPWCHSTADYIDTFTTYCPECIKEIKREDGKPSEGHNLVHRSTVSGVNAYIRAKQLVDEARG